MDKALKYVTLLLLLIFMGWYFYRQGKQDAKFKQQIEQIDKARKSLADSIKILKANTTLRDEKLREVIVRDVEIMDTLNFTLKKLNANSKAIESKIEIHKKTLDELWRSNK